MMCSAPNHIPRLTHDPTSHASHSVPDTNCDAALRSPRASADATLGTVMTAMKLNSIEL